MDCAQCGQTFVAKRSTARFCSTRCRMAAHRIAHKAKDPAPALVTVCVVCGREFQPKRAGAKYCSKACNQKMYRRRYNEWKKRAMMKSRPVNN